MSDKLSPANSGHGGADQEYGCGHFIVNNPLIPLSAANNHRKRRPEVGMRLSVPMIFQSDFFEFVYVFLQDFDLLRSYRHVRTIRGINFVCN